MKHKSPVFLCDYDPSKALIKLPPGSNIIPIKPDTKTQEFLKIQRELRDEIIRIFAVPPVILGGQNGKRTSKKSGKPR